MNILFINYGSLQSNSMSHIGPYADELSKRGHSCSVAIDCNDTTSNTALYSIYSHRDIQNGIEVFPNARPAEIIHTWTPRENVRKTAQNYQARFPATKLLIHLEDNEDAILESEYQRPIEWLRQASTEDIKREWNQSLSHPVEYKRFLATADAITLLTLSLENLVPNKKETLLISPIVYESRFSVSTPRSEILTRFGIPEKRNLIVFPGGISPNNREDLRQLYIAVKILQQDGIAALIIKTGPSCPAFENSFAFPLEGICLDLGYIDDAAIPELLSIADILIQPGIDNSFNRDRFPCKIPEFFAAAKPCLIPAFYTLCPSAPESCCLLLETSSPEEIATQAKRILTDSKFAKKLGTNAKSYALKKYSPKTNTDLLVEFYEHVSTMNPPSGSTKRYTFENLKKRNNELAAKNKDLQRELDRQRQSLKPDSPLQRFGRFIANFHKRNKAKTAETIPPEGHPSYHKDYYKFIPHHERRIDAYLNSYRKQPPHPESQPKISILLPVYNVEEEWLRLCIDSVRNQVYQNWELCISDDHSTKPHIKPVLDEYARIDNRISVAYRESNGHISLASNTAFALATGSYIALLDHDDELTRHALARVADAIAANPNAKIIYSDEDKIDNRGLRHGPHFKSDWNYDLFLGCNMISHLGIYSRNAFEEAGGFRQGYEGAQDWDLALRVIETCEASQIVHIPEILYHWRDIAGSTARNINSKDYAYNAQRKAIADHLKRINITATLESVDGNHWHVIYKLPEIEPLVSIIIPTKDRLDLLQPCIDSILEKTTYENFEIIVVDNASVEQKTIDYLAKIDLNKKIQVLHDQSEFNYSALNNRAIEQTDSVIICLLNNDTEVISENWLSEMIRHALRPNIGVVGAKLLFPHEHVQHGGVIMGIGGVAAHAFKFLHKNDDGHLSRAKLVSQFSAVTGACMAFKKSLWEELNGLDEKNLAISYNDIDFCLRANNAGYNNLVTPFALLYHKESESRGDSQSPNQVKRFSDESNYMYQKWANLIQNDPFYNPSLTLDKEDFSYRI